MTALSVGSAGVSWRLESLLRNISGMALRRQGKSSPPSLIAANNAASGVWTCRCNILLAAALIIRLALGLPDVGFGGRKAALGSGMSLGFPFSDLVLT